MAYVLASRVQETSTTTGTGTLTLGGAVSGFRTFASVMSNGDKCHYAVVDTVTGDWETGLGTYSSSTLARTTVIESTNSNAAVSFAANSKSVMITPDGQSLVTTDDTGTVRVPDKGTAIPSSPSGTAVGLFSRQVAGRKMLAQIAPDGDHTSLQPMLARNKIGYWNPSGSSSTVPGIFGIPAPTALGTVTTRSVTTTNLATRMRRMGLVGVASAGNLAGYYQTNTQYTAGSGTATDGSGFMMVMRFVPSDAATVSGAISFHGMRNSTSAPSATASPETLTKVIGVGQQSGDGTQLYFVYGGTSAQTSVALGATHFPAAPASTIAYEVAIYSAASETTTFHVQVTNLTDGTIYTNTVSGGATVVPQATDLMNWACFRANNATALACSVDLCSVYMETDT